MLRRIRPMSWLLPVLTSVSLAAGDAPVNVRATALQVIGRPEGGFTRLEAAALGLQFTNRLANDRAILNRNLLNGSGVAAGDVDGDGRCDLYFCGLESGNALFRNLGDWRFVDITASAGVACPGQDSTGALLADVDQDGDLDLLVTALNRGARLFRNQGPGTFEEVTAESGLVSPPGGTTLAMADVEGDGDLDLYLTNYRPDTVADMPSTTFQMRVVDGWPVVVQVNGQPVTLPQWTNRFEVSAVGRVLERGLPDQLFLNDGHGRFAAVSWTAGTFRDEDGRPLAEPPHDWGLTAQFHDFTGDGAPDLYVCNDFVSPDRIWINDGKGQFRAIARQAIRTTSAFSMGVDGADIDRDGDVDLFVVDMLSSDHRKRHVQLGERSAMRPPAEVVNDRLQISRNSLQLNRGDGTFEEVAHFAGIEASDWSWQPVFLDVDLDGYEDILIGNGVLRDFQNVDFADRMEAARTGRGFTRQDILEWIGRFPRLDSPNMAFRNRGDGRFEEHGVAWGFAEPGISQGMALADLDNDGDLDVVINNLQGAPGLFRNETSAPRVAIRLAGRRGLAAGIGALIRVQGGPVNQSQEVISGGRYLSGDQAQRTFAARSPEETLNVEIAWRRGGRTSFEARPNTLYDVEEPQSISPVVVETSRSQPLFEEVVLEPAAPHMEADFDEAGRQPLLTRRLDRLGPGVSWHDLNQDGWLDLIVGNGRGGLPSALVNLQGTNFTRWVDAPLDRPLTRDQSTVLGVREVLISGSSNYEDASSRGGLVRLYDTRRRVAGDNFRGFPFAAGPLALADVDGDGDLDLFVGGRVVPGRYPEPADSILFRNDAGRLVPLQRWEKLGLTSGAVFSDLDADGFPELILAMEWGPIRAFQRGPDGVYAEKTAAWGLEPYSGWWTGVATGDFDGDGTPEILASNWGLNSRYRASPQFPQRLHYGDLDDNGTIDLVRSRFLPELGKEVPEQTLDLVRAAMPFLHQRVPDFTTYGQWSIQEIYGDALKQTRVLEARTLATTLFRFQGGRVAAAPLPAEAQRSPAFGIAVGDMDGDGAEDAFLSQNFFAVGAGEARCDAGRGLWLRGNGRGHLDPVSAQQSGIRVYGEQRGCALGDFDADGRVDLAIGQNGATVRVFRNVSARPGLRVRLLGPDLNSSGVGAQLWLSSGDVRGAVREVQAGSGYWSQNSAVSVLALPGGRTPERMHVRWPGGRLSDFPIPAGAVEIEVAPDRLRVVQK